MNLQDYLAEIDRIQQEIAALPPLSPEQRAKLWSRIRLDWNYHSNALEGNTLTLSETQILLTQGIHAGNKLGRHYEEIKLHDEVLEWVQPMITEPNQEDFALSEKLIRELHHKLMGEDYKIDATNSQGERVKIAGQPGRYKVTQNYVQREGEEQYYYSSPEAVPDEMRNLVQWIQQHRHAQGEEATHPVLLAAIAHLRFVTIHPFDDGNGRMGRLIMNILLMQERLAPAIIEKEERGEYIKALVTAQTDDDRMPFYELIAKATLEGMELRLKAYKGESLRRLDDWEKEAELLKIQLKEIKKEYTQEKTPEFLVLAVTNLLEKWLLPAKQIIDERFKDLFEKTICWVDAHGKEFHIKHLHSNNAIPNQKMTVGVSDTENIKYTIEQVQQREYLEAFFSFEYFNIPGYDSSRVKYRLQFVFKKYYYSIFIEDHFKRERKIGSLELKYDQPFNDEIKSTLTSLITEDVVDQIKRRIEEYKKSKNEE